MQSFKETPVFQTVFETNAAKRKEIEKGKFKTIREKVRFTHSHIYTMALDVFKTVCLILKLGVQNWVLALQYFLREIPIKIELY